MTELLSLRIGAVAAMGGGVLIVVGNILHPRESGQLDSAETLLEVVAGSAIWGADHVVIATGIALLLGAFYGLTQSIRGPGVAWARLGWGVGIIGVTLGLLFMLTEVVAMSALADEWASSSGAKREQALAAGSAIFQMSLTLAAAASLVLFGVTPMLYGAAVLASDEYASWLGWVGLIGGALTSGASFVQLFTGITTLTGLILVPLGIVVVTLWIILLGVQMWRKSVAGATAQTPHPSPDVRQRPFARSLAETAFWLSDPHIGYERAPDRGMRALYEPHHR